MIVAIPISTPSSGNVSTLRCCSVYKISGINYDLDLGLGKEEIYACLGEVLILTWKDWDGNYSIGKVDPKHVHEVLAEEKKVGLSLADFRNSRGIITGRDIEHFKSYRLSQ